MTGDSCRCLLSSELRFYKDHGFVSFIEKPHVSIAYRKRINEFLTEFLKWNTNTSLNPSQQTCFGHGAYYSVKSFLLSRRGHRVRCMVVFRGGEGGSIELRQESWVIQNTTAPFGGKFISSTAFRRYICMYCPVQILPSDS